MIEPGRLEELDVWFKRTVLVCVAETGIIPILLFVTYVMRTGVEEPRGPASALLTFIFGVVALLVLACAVGLRDWLRSILLRAPLAANAAHMTGTGSTEAGMDAVASALFTWNLIVFGIGEVPILLGFVHTIAGGTLVAFAGFTMVGAAIWYLNFPRRSSWIAFIEADEARAAGYSDIVR